MALYSLDESKRRLDRSMPVIQRFNPFVLVIGRSYKNIPRIYQNHFNRHQRQRGTESKMMNDLTNRPLIGRASQIKVGFVQSIKRRCNFVTESRVGNNHLFV